MKCPNCGATVARGVSSCRGCGGSMARNTPAMPAMPAAPTAATAQAPVPVDSGVPVDPYQEPRRRHDLKVLATITVALLGLHAVVLVLVLLGVRGTQELNVALLTATAVSLVTWLFQARTNVDGIGYRHQLPKAFAIAGWLIPLGFLYLPVRFVLDVWWARLPRGGRGAATAAVLTWWALWCLAWFTSFRETVTLTRGPNGRTVQTANYTLYLGDTVLSCVFLLLAAGALVLVVLGISRDDARLRGVPPHVLPPRAGEPPSPQTR